MPRWRRIGAADRNQVIADFSEQVVSVTVRPQNAPQLGEHLSIQRPWQVGISNNIADAGKAGDVASCRGNVRDKCRYFILVHDFHSHPQSMVAHAAQPGTLPFKGVPDSFPAAY